MMKPVKERKQLGILIDPDLWKEMRMVALRNDMTATDALHAAMEEYIARHSGETRWVSSGESTTRGSGTTTPIQSAPKSVNPSNEAAKKLSKKSVNPDSGEGGKK
jgi:hypothetical protein